MRSPAVPTEQMRLTLDRQVAMAVHFNCPD